MSKELNLTCVALSKENVGYLKRISKKTHIKGGRQLSKSSIVRAMVAVCTKMNVDVTKVKSEKELECRFKEAFKCYGKQDGKLISNGKDG